MDDNSTYWREWANKQDSRTIREEAMAHLDCYDACCIEGDRKQAAYHKEVATILNGLA